MTVKMIVENSVKKGKIIKNYDLNYKMKISTFDFPELIEEEEENDVLFVNVKLGIVQVKLRFPSKNTSM